MVPEAVAFSFVAGVEPTVGLTAAWIIGLTTALLGGRPGMVSGATGAMAVVMGPLVREKGIEYLFYSVILCGVLQIILGMFQVSRLTRLISAPVMIGFVNGLGIVIGMAQFSGFRVPQGFLDDIAANSGGRRLNAFTPLDDSINAPWAPQEVIGGMMLEVVLTMAVTLILPRFTKFPAALTGIAISMVLEHAVFRNLLPIGPEGGTILVRHVASVKGSLPPLVFTQYDMPALGSEVFGTCFPLSIVLACIGLIESLMTLQLIDEITNTKGSPVRECLAQGLGNLLCGLFGSMGGCAMIGQSMINVDNGGAGSRLAATIAAAFTLLIILAAYPLIGEIPVAALVGVMWVVSYKTFDWGSLRLILAALPLPAGLRKRFALDQIQGVRPSDAVVIVAVTVVTLFWDLAVAVFVGIVISCVNFSWRAGDHMKVNRNEEKNKAVYDLEGLVFFSAVPPLQKSFDPENDPDVVEFRLKRTDLFDFSAVESIKALKHRYERQNKELRVIDVLTGQAADLGKERAGAH